MTSVKRDELPKPEKCDEPLTCKHCGVSLLGDPIPKDIRPHYAGNYFKREIGHYDMEKDRTTAFFCPDCKKKI